MILVMDYKGYTITAYGIVINWVTSGGDCGNVTAMLAS